MHALTRSLTHLYIAEVVGTLREGEWNDDRRARGCVAKPWQ